MAPEFTNRITYHPEEQAGDDSEAVLIVTQELGGHQNVLTYPIQSVSLQTTVRDAISHMGFASHISIVHPLSRQAAYSLATNVNHLAVTKNVRTRVIDVMGLIEDVVILEEVQKHSQATVISLQRYTS